MTAILYEGNLVVYWIRLMICITLSNRRKSETLNNTEGLLYTVLMKPGIQIVLKI